LVQPSLHHSPQDNGEYQRGVRQFAFVEEKSQHAEEEHHPYVENTISDGESSGNAQERDHGREYLLRDFEDDSRKKSSEENPGGTHEKVRDKEADDDQVGDFRSVLKERRSGAKSLYHQCSEEESRC